MSTRITAIMLACCVLAEFAAPHASIAQTDLRATPPDAKAGTSAEITDKGAGPAVIADANFDRQAERLRAAVYRRPHAGATFDLWFNHYATSGQTRQWQAGADAARQAKPDDAAAQLTWALVCERMNQWPEAAAAFARAAELAPDDYYARSRLAQVQLRLGQHDDAMASLAKALTLRVPPAEYLTLAKQLGALYAKADQREQAIGVYRAAATRFAKDAKVIRELASALQQLQEAGEAARLWRVLADTARDPQLRFEAEQQLALLSLAAGDTDSALGQLSALLHRAQSDSWQAADLRARLNAVLLQTGGTPRLVAFWKAEREARPQDLPTLSEYAKALASDNRTAEAVAEYRAALSRAVNNRQLREQLLETLIRHGDVAAAIIEAEMLANSAPNDANAWFRLGQLRLSQNTDARTAVEQQAIADWQRACDTRRNDAMLALRAADLCRAAAVGSQDETLRRQPGAQLSPELQQRHAVLLDAAEAFYREAANRQPDGTFWEYLGEFLHRRGQGSQAVEAWRQMATLHQPAAWGDAALLMHRHGYVTDAINAALQAVEQQPSDLGAWQSLIEWQLATDEEDAALLSLGKMEQAGADKPSWQRIVQELRAGIEVRAGRLDVEIARLTAHLAATPDDANVAWSLSQLLQTSGDIEAALRVLAPLVNREDASVDTRLLLRYAELLAQHDQPGDAAAAYGRLIRLDATHSKEQDRRHIELLEASDQLPAAADAAAALLRRYPRDPDTYLQAAHIAQVRRDTEAQLSFLQRATTVAPRDVQVRKQYAIALREADRLADALEEAAAALEAAESPAERLALVAWLVGWQLPTDQSAWLEQRLRANRARDASHAADWTRCLILALKATGQTAAAFDELTGLLATRPLDAELLQDTIDTAVASQRLPDAIRFQQQLVALDATPQAWQRLARLHRQAGQPLQALQIWDRILEEQGSESNVIATVDEACRHGSLLNAQMLVESALSRRPDSWQLAYRAGLIHIALDQADEATTTWRSLLTLSDTSGATAPSDPLHTACMASLHFLRLSESIRRFGVAHRSVREAMFDADDLRGSQTTSLQTAQIYAAVAWYLAIGGEGKPPADNGNSAAATRPQPTTDNPASLSVLACAAWATQQMTAAEKWSAEWLKIEPHAAVAQIIRFLMPFTNSSSVEAAQQRLRASYVALQAAATNSNATDVSLLHLAYARSLSRILPPESLAPTLSTTIDQMPPPAALDLLPLVNELPAEIRTEMAIILLSRCQRTFEASETTIDARKASELLATVLNWSDIDRPARLQLIVPLFAKYVQAPHAPRPTVRDPRAGAPSGVRSGLRVVDRTGSRDAAAAAPSSLWKQLRLDLAMLAQPDFNSIVNLSQPRTQVGSERHATRWSIVRSVSHLLVEPERAAELPTTDLYPLPSAWLDGSELAMLRDLAQLADSSELRAELLKPLLESQNDEIFRVQTRAALQWWWNEQAAARSELESLAARFPSQLELQYDVARLRLLVNDLPAVNQVLRSLPPEASSLPEVSAIRNALWDRWSAQLLAHELKGHEGAVSGLAVDSTGRWLVSGGVDATVRVWDMEAATLKRTLEDNRDIVLAVAISPDGQEIAAGGYDRAVRRWSMRDGTPLGEPWQQEATIRSLRYSPDGRYLVSAGDDRSLIVWDRAAQAIHHRLLGHTDAVLALGINASNVLLSAGNDRSLRWWNLDSGEAVAVDRLDRGAARAIAYDARSQSWLAGSDAGQVLEWPPFDAQSKTIAAPSTHEIRAAVRALTTIPGRPWIAIGHEDQVVELLHRQTLESQVVLKSHTGRILAVVADPAGKWLASAGFDGVIRIWKLP